MGCSFPLSGRNYRLRRAAALTVIKLAGREPVSYLRPVWQAVGHEPDARALCGALGRAL